MIVLVTGSEGFIGKNILKTKRYKFKTIDDHYFKENNPEESLKNFLDEIKPDVILHIGACSDTQNVDVDFVMERNYLSTKWLVDWCVKNKKKIVYSSSAAIYGVDGTKPSNLYGWSKLCGEDYVLANGGISLRYFNVYGPGEGHKGRMSSMIPQNFDKKEVELFPNKPKRDFVFIDDVVSANFYALENYDSLKDQWYEVGSGQSVEFETIFDNLDIKYSYKKESEIPKGYQFYTSSSIEKYMPGWKPSNNIEEGIKKYMDYLSERSDPLKGVGF